MTNQVAEVLRMDGKITDFVNRYTRKDGTLVDVLWSASWSEADKIMFCVAHDVTDRARIEKGSARGEGRGGPRQSRQERISFPHEPRAADAAQRDSRIRPAPRAAKSDARPSARASVISSAPAVTCSISLTKCSTSAASKPAICNCRSSRFAVADALEEALSLMRPLAAERGIELSRRRRWRAISCHGRPAALQTSAAQLADQRREIHAARRQGDRFCRRLSEPAPCASSLAIPEPAFSPEKLARLFTPFDRLGAEQTGVEGTGLGLALCQRLMQAMNGPDRSQQHASERAARFGWSWPAAILRSSVLPQKRETARSSSLLPPPESANDSLRRGQSLQPHAHRANAGRSASHPAHHRDARQVWESSWPASIRPI